MGVGKIPASGMRFLVPGNIIFGAPVGSRPISVKGPLLVGESERKPGYNEDGSVAEDMLSGDKPAKSASIQKSDLFKLSNRQLQRKMELLMENYCTGDMQKAALDMVSVFCEGKGGTYSNSMLDNEVKNDSEFADFHVEVVKKLAKALKHCNYDLAWISPPFDPELFDFYSTANAIGGLVITVHQVWSVKVELESYFCPQPGIWSANLNYTLYDHFGLDWQDIKKTENNLRPPGDYFKAWYILQHYRHAKPFITEIRVTVPVSSLSVVAP